MYGDYVIASDGHILIQAPIRDVTDCPELKDESEFVSEIFTKIKPNCDFTLDLASIPEYKTEPLYEECPVCEGEGIHYANGDKCKACKGTGHTDKQIGIVRAKTEFYKIGKAYYNPDFIKLVHENFPYKWHVTTINCAEAMKMQYENITILLMPVRAEHVEDNNEANIYELTLCSGGIDE
jgi:hypothetical protein